MGVYTVNCPVCETPHYWFSSNLDQRCENCKNKGEDMGEKEGLELIDSLRETIAAQFAAIDALQQLVEALKHSQALQAPLQQPFVAPAPSQPNNPYYTQTNPFLQPPYTITSGPNSAIITSTPLPPGSIQSQNETCNSNNTMALYSTNRIVTDDGSRLDLGPTLNIEHSNLRKAF